MSNSNVIFKLNDEAASLNRKANRLRDTAAKLTEEAASLDRKADRLRDSANELAQSNGSTDGGDPMDRLVGVLRDAIAQAVEDNL
jgi:prefoldin subunit 5